MLITVDTELLYPSVEGERFAFSHRSCNATGTHYEVGVQVGKHFSTRIKEYVQKSDELNKILLPFSQTSQGRSIVERFVMVNQRAYPDYFEEIQGFHLTFNPKL